MSTHNRIRVAAAATSTNMFVPLLLVIVVIVVSALRGIAADGINLHYRAVSNRVEGENRMETITTLTLKPDDETEATVVLYGQHDPALRWFEKVDKFLKEGAAAREDLLRRYGRLLEETVALVQRGQDDDDFSLAQNVLQLKPDMVRLKRELNIIVRAQTMSNNKHDELYLSVLLLIKKTDVHHFQDWRQQADDEGLDECDVCL